MGIVYIQNPWLLEVAIDITRFLLSWNPAFLPIKKIFLFGECVLLDAFLHLESANRPKRTASDSFGSMDDKVRNVAAER